MPAAMLDALPFLIYCRYHMPRLLMLLPRSHYAAAMLITLSLA